MAEAVIGGDKIGVLNIILKQGDNKPASLVFKNKDILGVLTPIDLTQYSSISMDIKTKVDVTEIPFISWSIGSGLTISGANNEILSFEFKQEFNFSQNSQWVYDMKFIKDSVVSHLISGVINVKKSIT